MMGLPCGEEIMPFTGLCFNRDVYLFRHDISELPWPIGVRTKATVKMPPDEMPLAMAIV